MRLVELAHGESVTQGDVTAKRLELDWRFDDPREVVFYKRYLEGKIYLRVTDEALEDTAADGWSWVEERLDEAAREQRGHYRDGRPV